MRLYASGLIDKSLRATNAKLQKKLVSDCRRVIHVSRKAMSSQELNSFIVISAEKTGVLDPKVVEEMEKGRVYNRFKKYYADNKSRLQQQLKGDQELRETSQIVKDFIKEVDPNLVKHFDSQLKKIIKALPASLLNKLSGCSRFSIKAGMAVAVGCWHNPSAAHCRKLRSASSSAWIRWAAQCMWWTWANARIAHQRRSVWWSAR